MREPFAAVRDQLVAVDRCAPDDERDADLAPRLVRHAGDCRVGDRRMRVEHRFDLGWIDVLAARDVHVLEPAADPVAAVLVRFGHVAGREPAVAEDGRGRLGVPPVAGEHVRAAHEQLALPAQPHLDERVRLAGRAQLPRRVLGRQAEHVRRGLRQAVALDDLDAA